MKGLNIEVKRNIRESLVYAISVSIKGKNASTTAVNLITDFYYSLGRKLTLLAFEVTEEVNAARNELDELVENWKYVQ